MERDSYIDGIRSAWLGEQFGEVFFKGMAERTENESMRAAWQTLARLEQVTGQKMAALLESHGEVATSDDPIEVGEEIYSRYTSVAHRESMLQMQGVVEKAIVHFDQLLAVAPDEDVPAVQFLVWHEQALQSFIERELNDEHDQALHDVEQLLKNA